MFYCIWPEWIAALCLVKFLLTLKVVCDSFNAVIFFYVINSRAREREDICKRAAMWWVRSLEQFEAISAQHYILPDWWSYVEMMIRADCLIWKPATRQSGSGWRSLTEWIGLGLQIHNRLTSIYIFMLCNLLPYSITVNLKSDSLRNVKSYFWCG